MNIFNIKKFLFETIYLTIGCIFSAFAVNNILKPNGLITSGITGIAFILEKYTNINYSIIYYVINMTVLIITFIILGKKEIIKIAFISIIYPLVLIVLQNYHLKFVENDLLLATIYFSIFNGIGIGMILRKGYSFGGTDTIAKILKKKFFKSLNISYILLVIDGLVIIASAFVFGRNIALYSIISQLITTKVYDYIIFGFGSKLYKLEIISDKYEDITNYIMYELKRGVTLIDITGAYSKEKKQKIITVCSPSESILIKELIKNKDEKAYVEVLPVEYVWGRGNRFININLEEY
ncbi:MAG: YitT family protein [Tissierellia bacterium]|nr:YitT family protein [Tissierellia bacterium]MDD4780024.1 YitT family protein [Tissierellia bacterium]